MEDDRNEEWSFRGGKTTRGSVVVKAVGDCEVCGLTSHILR